MATSAKTVWILGTGFSKSLGGPLLHELISQKTAEETREVFPRLGKREVVYRVYERGLNTLWSHAEEFLDYVDTALLSDSPRRAIFTRRLETVVNEVWGRPDHSYNVEQFRDEAILTVAAECSTYTRNVDTRSEAWHPYRHWKSKRGDWDTVITFNYDLVLESLMVEGSAIDSTSFVLPKRSGYRAKHTMPILKLHGSVNWGVSQGGEVEIVGDIEDFISRTDVRPLIATPGATKTNYCNKHLLSLWSAAADALREAEVIVFLGYRFPPSDSEAREKLLRPIAENKSAILNVHTVLGPKVNDDPTARLTGLLQHTLEGAGRSQGSGPHVTHGYRIFNEPLYVEDFLSVVKSPTLRATP